LSLRPNQTLRKRRFCDQERLCDFGCRQSAERPESQRDLRVEIERRMATGKDQAQTVIRKAHRGLFDFLGSRNRDLDLVTESLLFIPYGLRAARAVDQFPMCGRHDPGGWILWKSSLRPGGECRG